MEVENRLKAIVIVFVLALLLELLHYGCILPRHFVFLIYFNVEFSEIILLIAFFNVFFDLILPKVDLLHDTIPQLSLAPVRNVVQAIQVNQLCVAKLRWERPIGDQICFFFLHFLQFRHLYQNLKHFVFRKALEKFGALCLVKLFKCCAFLLKAL